MAYTTESAVRAIIDLSTGLDVASFIETANALVEEVCAANYDSTRLELIERWLAAHFAAIAEPRAAQEGVGPLREQIESKVDLGFDVTRYGQMAMRLDTAGGLAALNDQAKKAGRPRLSFHWLGDCD